MELPNELRVGLDQELRGLSPGALVRETTQLSARYRMPGNSKPCYGIREVQAYAASRMPATFAAGAAAMQALAVALPEFEPRTLLDVGAGTGSAMWAAAAVWADLDAATLIEGDPNMIALGRRLAADARGAIRATHWVAADLAGQWDAPPHDLVTAAYLLGELSDEARGRTVDRLWERTLGALLLIEPGTPRGWAVINAAREQLRAAGAWLVAPCPHQGACPLPPEDWCHFAQRLARSRAHRVAKEADLGYEDEKFAYIAVNRGPGVQVAARVLRRPIIRPGRVELALCTSDGLRQAVVTKRDRGLWHLARDLNWGAGLQPDDLNQLRE